MKNLLVLALALLNEQQEASAVELSESLYPDQAYILDEPAAANSTESNPTA